MSDAILSYYFKMKPLTPRQQRPWIDAMTCQTNDEPLSAAITLEAGIPLICAIVEEFQSGGNLKVCGAVAAITEIEIGWKAVAGKYFGTDDDYARNYPDDGVRHCWNVLPDGTIVDGTANQFTYGEAMPRVISTDDPRYFWYGAYYNFGCGDVLREWSPDHPAHKAYERS